MVQRQSAGRGGKCCVQNAMYSDEHDISCEQVSFGEYPRSWNLSFDSVPMGVSVPYPPRGPPELFRTEVENDDNDSGSSDSDIIFLSNPSRVIVNIGASVIEPIIYLLYLNHIYIESLDLF